MEPVRLRARDHLNALHHQGIGGVAVGQRLPAIRLKPPRRRSARRRQLRAAPAFRCGSARRCRSGLWPPRQREQVIDRPGRGPGPAGDAAEIVLRIEVDERVGVVRVAVTRVGGAIVAGDVAAAHRSVDPGGAMGRLIGQENGQRARPCRNHQLQVQPGPMAGTKLDHDITDGDAASAALAARRHPEIVRSRRHFPKSQCSTCERIHCRCRIHCAGLVTGPATSPSVLRSGSGRWAFEGRASKSGGVRRCDAASLPKSCHAR